MKTSILRVLGVLIFGMLANGVMAVSPTSSIIGSTFLDRDETGSWTYSASDTDSDLLRWRVKLNNNSSTAWTSISGGSASSGFSYSFSSSGTYTFDLEVEDVLHNVSTSTVTVVVNTPPQINLLEKYAGYSGPGFSIRLNVSDINGNMDYYTLIVVGQFYVVGPGAPTSNGTGFTLITSPISLPSGTYTVRLVVGDSCSIPGDATRYGIQEISVTVP